MPKNIIFQKYFYKERLELLSQICKDVGNLIVAAMIVEQVFADYTSKFEIIIWGAIVAFVLYWTAIRLRPQT